MINLIPGQIVNNTELQSVFQCSPQGGMRKSNRTNSLVIVSNHVKSIYDDRWHKDILYYTGMGTEGDQSFDFMQNKTLFLSKTNGVAVYLFEVFVDKQYTYMGEVQLANKPFFENQPDKNNNIRKVCIFPVKIVGEESPLIDKKSLDKNVLVKEKRIKKLDDVTLLFIAKKGNEIPGIRNVVTKQYERNLAVAEYAKRVSKGKCQLCREKAPFNNKNGEPYLETHHIDWLSKGGSDTIENTIALCPNCHTKMHVVNDEQDIAYLKDLMIKNSSELDL